jgi:hypothetical protein
MENYHNYKYNSKMHSIKKNHILDNLLHILKKKAL